MAFSLSVQGGTLPANLRIEWAQAFASVDIPLTFSPNLSSSWGGGFLPAKCNGSPPPGVVHHPVKTCCWVSNSRWMETMHTSDHPPGGLSVTLS